LYCLNKVEKWLELNIVRCQENLQLEKKMEWLEQQRQEYSSKYEVFMSEVRKQSR
jgi:hypothetical protein